MEHRRYVPYSAAHYAGNLVDGAWGLGLFGDVATELCIRTDGDEGLFASYSDVQFRAPVHAGDTVVATATLTRVGTRSRQMDFELVVVARGEAAGRVRPRRSWRRPSWPPRPPEPWWSRHEWTSDRRVQRDTPSRVKKLPRLVRLPVTF